MESRLSTLLANSRKLVALLALLGYFLALAKIGASEGMVDTLGWAGFAAFTSFVGGNAAEHWQKGKATKADAANV